MAKYKCIYDGKNPDSGQCTFHNKGVCNNSNFCKNHEVGKFRRVIDNITHHTYFPVWANFKCTYKETKYYKNVCPYFHSNRCNKGIGDCHYKQSNNWKNIRDEFNDFFSTSF